MDTSSWYVFLTKKACNEICFFLCLHKDHGSFITYVEQKFKATAVWNMTHFHYLEQYLIEINNWQILGIRLD